MDLEQIKSVVRSALGAFDDTHLYPRVRAGAAFEFLRQLLARRDELPEGLRAPFDELWASFGPVPQNLTDEQAARCAQLTRKFAGALESLIGDDSERAADPEPAKSPDDPEDRAAADS